MFRNDDGDDVRIALAKWSHELDQHSTKYNRATYAELAKMFAARSKSEIAAEYKRGTSFVEAKPFVRIFNWMRRTGFSVAREFEEQGNPPNRAEMLLHFGLPKRDREYMIGDLEEEYRGVILPKYGPRVAARWYWWQAVRSVVATSGARVRIWLSFGGLARAAGWIVEKFTL